MTAEAGYAWGKGLKEADVALLERLVTAIRRYRMEVPAIFMMESLLPLALVGSQAMHFFAPVAGIFVGHDDYDRLARLVERRDVIERMMCRLEAHIDAEKG